MPHVSQILPFVFHNLGYVPFIYPGMTVLSAEIKRYSKLIVRNISRHWRTCTLQPQYSCSASTLHHSCTRLPVCIHKKMPETPGWSGCDTRKANEKSSKKWSNTSSWGSNHKLFTTLHSSHANFWTHRLWLHCQGKQQSPYLDFLTPQSILTLQTS